MQSSPVQESAHKQGTISKALSVSPEQFVDEYVEPRLRATQVIARAIAQTAQDGSLSQVEAARAISNTVADIWGQPEFSGLYSPGSTFGLGELLMGTRPGALSGSR